MRETFSAELSKYMRAIKPAVFFMIGIVLLISCKKEGNIGSNIQPEDDIIAGESFDTITLITQTYRQDSVRTDESTLAISGIYSQMLGSYVDPIFGKSSASLYAQVSLPGNISNVNLGNPADLVLDSVVLTLPYSGNGYGTKSDPQTFRVYELNENLYRDSAYYSNTSKQVLLGGLGSKSFTPNPDSSISIGGIKLKAHLRIKLDSALGVKLLSQSGTSNFENNVKFHEFFKGIYIAPDNPAQTSGQGSIFRFLINDPLTAITIYYRNIGSTPDTAEYSFPVNTNSAYFNHFEHDYTVSADILSQISSNTFSQNGLVYVQPMQGLKVKVEIPYLKNHISSGASSINRAEIILKVDPSSVSIFSAPSRMYVVGIDSLGKNYPLSDMYEGESFYGGNYNATTNEFRFNVTRHIQSLLTGGKKNHGLYILSKVSDSYNANALFLSAATGSANPERVVLGGGGNAGAIKMKLKLTYTKMK